MSRSHTRLSAALADRYRIERELGRAGWHSFQLIMHAERLNFTSRDRYLVALISRYHRRRGPNAKHDEFTRLTPEEQGVVRRLSGILRVADGLDRGHTSAVERVSTRITSDRLTIRATPKLRGADLSLECWGAAKKSNVLAKVLGREVVVVPGRREAEDWRREGYAHRIGG